MSRVKAVVDRSIMVSIYDVVPGDVICVGDGEGDPIVERVEVSGAAVRFHYKSRPNAVVNATLWMNPEYGKHVFIHDLKNERQEFQGNGDLLGS